MSTAVSSRPRSSSVNSRPTSRSTNYRASQVSKQPTGRNANIPNDGKRQIVGQYMLGKTIGEGTFGKVKLAVHMPSGEKVAIKILEKSRIKESADVRRVNREIKILKKARHSNIIQLYEVLDTPNAIYLIMECAEGGEMFDFIVAQKHVPEVQACKFFHQIVDGVENLHMNEITHRDLKPENLLLKASPDGWIVKVVDFGLSNTHEGNRLLSTACGSPCYAAPEMIAGKKYVGPMADIWSMGVILFALVCGYLPFEDANTAILYKKILSGDYKPPKWISPEVKDLIRCILEVDPRKRFTMSDIRKHPWYQMVSEANIPREIIDEREEEITRNETLKILSTSGIDIQQLLDGLASHACNSLTATYYLFEQKHRAVRAKQAQNAPPPSNNAPHHYQSDNQITNNPHHSNAPGAVNNNNNNNNDHQPGHNRPKSNPNPQLPETNTANPTPNTTTNTNNTNITNPSNNNNNNNNAVSISPVKVSPLHPVILPSTTAGMSPKAKNIINPQNMFNNNNNNNNNNNENTNINNVNPTRLSINNNPGPYLQTPQIIQQARQQAQASLNNNNQPPSPTNGSINGANNGNNMPSLDYYMKTGLTLPIGVTANNNNNNNNNNNKSKPNNAVQPLASLPVPTSNNNGAVEIPKLQLKNARNVVVPPLQRPSINNNNEPLQSQTARLPVPNALLGQMNTNNNNNINNINNNVAMAPVSARAVLETTQHNVIIPSEFSPSNNSAGDPFDEGKGRPSTRRSRMRSRNGNDEQQQAIHEPLPAEGLLEMEQIPIKHNTTILNANDGSSDSSKVNEVMKEVQKMGINNEHNTTSIKAPEAPRGSSSNGGRRGKNLVTQQATAAPTTTTTSSNNAPLQPTAPTAARPSNPNPNAVKAVRPSVMSSLPAGVPPDSTAFNENRNEANRNKVANQGTIRFH